MIHFHGGPVTPLDAAIALWTRRHALVSMAHPTQLALAFEIAQSVLIDNGAFTRWREDGSVVDVGEFADFVSPWEFHPAYAGALIPDQIDGTAFDNDRMIARWLSHRIGGGGPGVAHA